MSLGESHATRTWIETKIIPPIPPAETLERHRLLRLLEDHRFPLILLAAGAGYGKTWLLASWAATAHPAPAWYTADESDQDVVVFLTYIIRALGRVWPPLLTRFRESFPSEGECPPDVLLAFLLNTLLRLSQPVTLIIDDFHRVEPDPAIRDAMDTLLRHRPPNLRLIIATRRIPRLAALARLQVAGQVLKLTEQDLRFSLEEAAALFQAEGVSLPSQDLEAFLVWTEGWPLALRLLSHSVRRLGIETVRCRFTSLPERRILYEWLAEAVLSEQPPEIRRFLLHTSILEQLSASLCNALLERDDAASMLARIERERLLLMRAHTEEGWYRYHPLFRSFLIRRLEEIEGTETVTALHRRAAAWFLERSDCEQAISHLLAAGDYQAAADLIQPLRERLFLTSRYHLLEHWLEQFPSSIAEAHPWLLLTRARLALMRGEYAHARRLCLQAEPFLQAQGDRAGLYTAYHDLAEITQYEGDFARAEALYRRALEYAVDDSQRAVCLGQMARCLYMRGGDVEEALRLLEQGMELIERSGFMLGRAGLLSLKGKMLSVLGDFRAALEAWHTALDLMEDFGNRHQQIGILNNAAYHHYLLGEFDQAEILVRRAMELAQAFDRQSHYAYALNVQGVIHQARGQWEDARRCHEEALSIQRRLNERYEIPVTLNWLGLLARREGRLDEALRWGEEGLARREKLGNDYETGLSLIDVGATYLELGQMDKAEELWQRALEIFTRHQARYEQAQLHFYLAVLAHRRGETEAAQTHLTTALDMARHHQYDYLFIQDAAWAAPLLLPLALRDEPFATALFLRLGAPAQDALLPLLEHPDPTTRARAARLLGGLGDGTVLKPLAALRKDPSPQVRQATEAALKDLLARPPEPLRVRVLGGFRLWRGEREVTRWPRRRARDVFLLLLAHHPQPVAADALAETLWPGRPPAKARQSLRRAIADLRHTLEPELPPAFPSRYLVTGEDTYALRLPEGSWVDVEAFERTLDKALALPTKTSEERRKSLSILEEALALYGGDYLPEVPYEDWVLYHRERLRERYLTALRRLARLRLAQGEIETALQAARRAWEADPWDEEAVFIMMQAYRDLGDIPAALRAYETLHDRLRRDLDLPPRDDLTALYHALRNRLSP